MTKRFYNLLNLLLAIVIFAGLIQTALRFVLGSSLFTQGSFLTFFLVEFGVALFMTAFVMKYYWSKKYKLAFFAAGLWVTISVIHASIIYLTLRTSSNTLYTSRHCKFRLLFQLFTACVLFFRMPASVFGSGSQGFI